MSLGGLIKEKRIEKGLKGWMLADKVNCSPALISKIEKDQHKGSPDPDLIIRISEALNSTEIMVLYITENPVYKRILPRVFPKLNNIRRDPAVIFSRIAREAEECAQAADILAEIFGNADPRRTPGFDEVFKAKMEQILDIKRAAEILEFELLSSALVNKSWLDDVYQRQQQKCINHGHHDPSLDEEDAA